MNRIIAIICGAFAVAIGIVSSILGKKTHEIKELKKKEESQLKIIERQTATNKMAGDLKERKEERHEEIEKQKIEQPKETQKLSDDIITRSNSLYNRVHQHGDSGDHNSND